MLWCDVLLYEQYVIPVSTANFFFFFLLWVVVNRVYVLQAKSSTHLLLLDGVPEAPDQWRPGSLPGEGRPILPVQLVHMVPGRLGQGQQAGTPDPCLPGQHHPGLHIWFHHETLGEKTDVSWSTILYLPVSTCILDFYSMNANNIWFYFLRCKCGVQGYK